MPWTQCGSLLSHRLAVGAFRSDSAVGLAGIRTAQRVLAQSAMAASYLEWLGRHLWYA